MPTTITGPVRLPDGTIPAHGRLIFQRRMPGVGNGVTLAGPVAAALDGNGAFSVSLQGEASGTRYAVKVEYQNGLTSRLISDNLPDVVVTGSGSSTLSAVSVVPIPQAASCHVIEQGETLNVGAQYLDTNDRPVAINDVSITSWVTRDGARQNLSVSKIDQAAGTFEISASAAITANLRGTYQWNIRLAAGARVVIEETTLIVNEVA
ncbi:hypothetical protein [Falsirhodobacter halotolerans]|uniref:hypothetical protein n=1 Tax=Falsirhodobacter halotolerans TaxID=1146892 RepID=UPI001FD2F73D|nr:hypothetical protein [Falsirhodobacter halotolerans]MCJ8139557.1 hypothetical protein [Falsirhodobacter halotolerans]